MRLRAEETILAAAYCVLCEYEGDAEIVDGEFCECPNCQRSGLIRDVVATTGGES